MLMGFIKVKIIWEIILDPMHLTLSFVGYVYIWTNNNELSKWT